jgi:hypothetical protein
MNEKLPERSLKQVRPAPLPPELRARLATPPAKVCSIRSHARITLIARLKPLALPLAAAVMIGFALHIFSGSDSEPTRTAPPVTLRQHEKTLLHSKRIQLFETEEGCWELVEQQWKEESSIANSHSPVLIRTSEITNTLICCPVAFD